MLNETQLQVGPKKVRIVEIEIYYNDDPYFNKAVEHTIPLIWYFRRNNPSVANLDYLTDENAGLEVSVGNLECPAGVLIRSIRDENSLIEGPANVVKYILNTTGFDDILNLACSKIGLVSAFDQAHPIHLTLVNQPKLKIHSAPRFGTHLNYEHQIQYAMRNLRFTTCPERLRIDRNLIALTMLVEYPEQYGEIKHILRLKDKSLRRWVRLFIQGLDTPFDQLPSSNLTKAQCIKYGSISRQSLLKDPAFFGFLFYQSPEPSIRLLPNAFTP